MQQYLTLKEYEEFAKKLIIRELGHRYVSDEAIGHVIYYIASGDTRYREDMGTKRSTFRMICGLGGVRTLHRLKPKNSAISLNMELQRTELSDIIEDKRFAKKESFWSAKDLIDKTELSKQERKYLDMYLDNMKFKEIADECGITKQAVYKSINSSIRKIKSQYVQHLESIKNKK